MISMRDFFLLPEIVREQEIQKRNPYGSAPTATQECGCATSPPPWEPSPSLETTEMKTTEQKTYLGDSVYAAFDGYHIVLTTANFAEPSNIIALEPDVVSSLHLYAQKLWGAKEETAPEPNRFSADLDGAKKYAKAQLEKLIKGQALVSRIAADLSETCGLNAYGGTYWFNVKDRRDVEVIMQLAPKWGKQTHDAGIDYDATIDGVEVKIRTFEGALPPTCKVVEEEVTIPATEARTVKRMVVKCAQPATETPTEEVL